MIKESVVTLKVAKPTDVYPIEVVEKFFEIRHITYVIKDSVSIRDENGADLVNPETGEPVVVKRLIIPEISNVQIILDESKDAKDESLYHLIMVSDVDDKLYLVTLETIFEAIMKIHDDRLMPYYFVDASVALPAQSGWYVCDVEGDGVRELYYNADSKHKWWKKAQGEWIPDANEYFAKPVLSWLSVGSMIKMADTVSENSRLFVRTKSDDEYLKVTEGAYQRLIILDLEMKEGEDQNDV